MRDFNCTLGVLVTAYFDGTLEHGNCGGCAVGNIVAASSTNQLVLVTPPNRMINSKGIGWPAVFCTVAKDDQIINEGEYVGIAKKQIDATGYTWHELARIEKAFEAHNGTYTQCKDEDSAMFNGLMAVVDVLADIHGIDLKSKEEAKALFVKN